MATPDPAQKTKRLEEELRTMRQIAFAAGLFQEDVTVRTLLESLGEGVVIIDSRGTIVLVNTTATRLFGHAKEDLVGKPLDVLIPERYRKAHAKHIAHFFKKPRIRPMGIGLELFGFRQDGSEFPVEISLSFLDTTSGCFGMAFISDITTRKEAEQTLLKRNQELDAFAHTVAHDLKSSLTVLTGHCQIIDRSSQVLPQEINASLKEIWKAGIKLDQIIDELLLLSSISREEVQAEPVDMSSVVAGAIERLQSSIDDRKAEIKLPDHFPTALGYGPWIEEIWFNYISNAIKYGGTPPRVQLGGTVRKDGFVDFWVNDNGKGLTPEERVDIFHYDRPHKKTALGGYGLGLSIVKRIAEKLNGRVAVKSGARGGSTFIFSLPFADETD
jgi:PAS domain S-box-containing protein